MDRVTYRYPIFRFFSWFSIVIAIDMLVSVFLWLDKMDGTKITSSIKDYGMVKSVFDLACVAVGRCIILIPVLGLLESMTISASQNGVQNSGKRGLLKFISLIIVLGGIAFTIYKGAKVIQNKNNSSEVQLLKDAQYALCISSFVFSILYFLLLFGYFKHLESLHCRYAVMKGVESGSEECNEEEKKKKKMNVGRLAALLKPVGRLVYISSFSDL